jgi:lysyl-tRNA synthetase class 2
VLDSDAPEVVCIDYADAIHDACGLDIASADVDALARAAEADDDLRVALGKEKDDWLDLLLATRVIPQFPQDRLTVLRHYPASQAALARLCPDDPSVADRFELFIGPVELANGYVELTNAEEQALRMRRDNEERERRGRPVRPVDNNLLAALRDGLPQCAGVAVGFERLQMIHDRTDDIRDVITFAFDTDT